MENKNGFLFISFISLFGSLTTYLLGGWDNFLKILVTLVILDYVTGLIASAVEGSLSSQIGFKGIAKKIILFGLVAVSHLIDMLLGYQHLIRDWTILFYIVNEILSIIENAHRVGLPIPPIIKQSIKLLKSQMKEKK